MIHVVTAKVAAKWVFPAPTWSGRFENERRAHGQPKKWNLDPFTLYTLRHTCLTRWAPHMDPWTLAYLAGHRDMSMTKRYIHPQEQNTRAAIERARSALGGHKNGHSPAAAGFSDQVNPALSN